MLFLYQDCLPTIGKLSLLRSKLECWNNGKICFDDKIEMANILLKTNLTVFHSSIIPFLRQAFKPRKGSIFSLSCRISETLNYRLR